MKRTLKTTLAFAMLSAFFLLLGPSVRAQEGQKYISGTVRESSGATVPGVTVRVKGSARNKGAITGEDGTYSIKASPGETLQFSSVGFVTKEATVGSGATVSIQLEKSSTALGEVVVTGYGGQTNTRKLSYSVTEVKGSELVAANNSNIGDALQGKVAGVTISQGTGGPSSSSRIQIRGNARLDNNTEPLFVIDGVLIQPATTGADSWATGADFGNILKDMNQDDFESISVLKGSAATALYGEYGLNGVILITTKKGHARKGLGVTYNQIISFDQPYKMLNLQNSFGGGLSSTFAQNAAGYNVPDISATPYDNPNGGYSYGPAFAGQTIQDLDGRIIKWKPNNPIKDFFQIGQYFNSNVAVDGASENGTFRASWTNLWNTSVMPANSMNKNAFTLRATHKLSSIFSLDASVNYTNVKIINPIQQGGGGDIGSLGGEGNPVQDFVYLAPRSADIAYYKHNYIASGGGLKQGITEDPYLLAASIWPAYQDNNVHTENLLLANLDLHGQFTPYLSLLVRANVLNYNDNTEYEDNGIGSGFTGGSYEEVQSQYRTTRVQALLTFKKDVGHDFELNLTGGGESDYQGIGNIVTATTNGGLQTPSLYFISNSVDAATISQTYNPSYLNQSFESFGDLTWRNMLTLNASFRHDWTSALTYANGTGHYSYSYPSVGLAWVFTELPEFQHSVMSYGKLRASLGWSGFGAAPWTTTTTGNYGYVGTFNNVSNANQNLYSFSNGQGSYTTTLGDPNLKNELAREIELGADIRFFHDRLGLDAAVYKKNSFNQIINLAADQESGTSSRYINAGNIQNEGVELLLTAVPVQTKIFKWDFSINFTRNVNKVIALYPGVTSDELQDAFGADVGAYAVAGQQYGQVITGYGFSKYEGANKSLDGQKVLNNVSEGNDGFMTYERASDYTKGGQDTLGTIMPTFLWGTQQNFSYKNFVLSIQVDSKVGGLMASATDQYGSETGSLKNSLPGRNAALGGAAFTLNGAQRNDGVIPNGVIADGATSPSGANVGGMTYATAVKNGLLTPIPAYAYYEDLYQWSCGIRAQSIFDNSWIALRQVTIGYNLPMSVVKPIHFQSLRVSLTGRNLIYLWKDAKDGVNPEGLYNNQASAFAEGGGLPLIRSMGASINASF